MVLLDTDHMSLLQRGGAEGLRIRVRLRALPLDDVATTIVSYEEQMRGWLGRLARTTTQERQIFDYSELKSCSKVIAALLSLITMQRPPLSFSGFSP